MKKLAILFIIIINIFSCYDDEKNYIFNYAVLNNSNNNQIIEIKWRNIHTEEYEYEEINLAVGEKWESIEMELHKDLTYFFIAVLRIEGDGPNILIVEDKENNIQKTSLAMFDGVNIFSLFYGDNCTEIKINIGD